MLCAMCASYEKWRVEITSCQMWFRASNSLSFQNLFLFLKKVIKQLWPHYFDARLIFLNFLVQRQCIFVLWRVIRSKPQTNKAKWLIYFAVNSILRRSLGTRPFLCSFSKLYTLCFESVKIIGVKFNKELLFTCISYSDLIWKDNFGKIQQTYWKLHFVNGK